MIKYMSKETNEQIIVATSFELMDLNKKFLEINPAKHQILVNNNLPEHFNQITPNDLVEMNPEVFCDLVCESMDIKWEGERTNIREDRTDFFKSWNGSQHNSLGQSNNASFYRWKKNSNLFVSTFGAEDVIEHFSLHKLVVPFGIIYKMPWGEVFVQYAEADSGGHDVSWFMTSYPSLEDFIAEMTNF